MLSRIFRDDFEGKKANRKRQIDTLKVFNDNVTELVEDVEYKIEFMSDETCMYILVNLPTEFPYEKPKLKIYPPVIHSWVDDGTDITKAPGLLNFTIHSDLGRVVQVVIREFQIRPPVLCDDKHQLQQGVTNNNTINIQTRPGTNTCMIQQQSPDETDLLTELNSMSVDQLKELNENADKLDELINKTKLSCVDTNVDSFMSNIEELAVENLTKEEILSRLRTQVTNSLKEFHDLRLKFEEKNREYERLCQLYQPENIRELLRQAALSSDEQSELITDRFLNKQIGIDQFLVEYLEIRKLIHLRKTKEEKLSNQLKELHRAGY